jgi:hypothetical protein
MKVIKIENIALYHGELSRADVPTTDLPEPLQDLILRYHLANRAYREADEATKERFLPILAQTDAVIAAAIYQLYPPADESVQVDKIKLLAMKAKALRLKLNTDQ